MNERGAADLGNVKLTPRAKALFQKGGGQVRGYVPIAEPGGKVDLVPWYNSPRVAKPGRPVGDDNPNAWNPRVIQQNIPVPEHVQEQMRQGIPKQVRREPTERYKVLLKRLIDNIQASKARHGGTALLPKSVEDEIRQLGWRNGEPNLLANIKAGDIRSIERYADWLTLRAAGQQRRADFRKTVTDHPAHYSA